MIYEKFRELEVDVLNFKFKTLKVLEILSYPPAGNDVVECLVDEKGKIEDVFIKFERSKKANFKSEYKNLKSINSIIPESPKCIEFGKYNEKSYIVLEKKEGERLSEIFKTNYSSKKKYLFNYGVCLANIHKINSDDYDIAFQRSVNECKGLTDDLDEYSTKIITWLKENDFEKKLDTFIHGDFHYANVLFKDYQVSGILDWEYSGRGFKEQDIAWTCVLRPTQHFMDNIKDIKSFLNGYRSQNNFDLDKFKWCYINGSIHFYLMNKENEKYKEKLKSLINIVFRLENKKKNNTI